MKILAICMLLLALGLASASPAVYGYRQEKHLQTNEMDDKDLATFHETLASSQEDEEEDDDDDDLSNVQEIFKVLAQVNKEQAKSEGDATSQIWGLVRRTLLGAGKRYLRKRYCKKRSRCTEEEEEKVMLQELLEAQDDGDDSDDDDDSDDHAELQSLFDVLNQMEAKKMQGDYDTAKAEGLLRKAFRKIRNKVKKYTRKRFCKKVKKCVRKRICYYE